MIGRIVEIADDHRHLHVSRGFLVVTETIDERNEIGRVPLDDIIAVITHAHGLSYTNNLLVALAERGIPFVLCGPNHNPVAMLWPTDGHHLQAKRIDAQLTAKLPLRKRLWADIVRSKLTHQAAVLEAVGRPHNTVLALVKKIRSGDVGNIEAQAAKRYWNLLFDGKFKRDASGDNLNILLNYGYTVFRAAMARAVIAAGLHPTLSLHHKNVYNPMRLVDDLMEPFRPVVDLAVYKADQNGDDHLTPELKRVLVLLLYEEMQTNYGATPIMVVMQRLATSLAQIYLGESNALDLPLPDLPLSLH